MSIPEKELHNNQINSETIDRIIERREDSLVNPQFNYDQLDHDLSSFLKEKENNVREITNKARTEIGKELYEASERLKNQGSKDGIFMEWYSSLGFKPKQVSRLLQRYELLTNCQQHERGIIEDLPISLTYEIAKPSANVELKKLVIKGDITTHKEYKELEEKMKFEKEKSKIAEEFVKKVKNELEQERKEAEQQKIEAKKEKEHKDQENKVLKTELDQQKQSSKVEKMKLVQQVQNLQNERDSARRKLGILEAEKELHKRDSDKYKKLKENIERLTEKEGSLTRQFENASNIGDFSYRIEKAFLRELAPVKYARFIEEIENDDWVYNALNDVVTKVEDWSKEMRGIMKKRKILRNGQIVRETIEQEDVNASSSSASQSNIH